MKQIRNIPAHDASMYFDGILVTGKATGVTRVVSVMGRDHVQAYPKKSASCYEGGDLLRRHWYVGIKKQVDEEVFKIITPEQLVDQYNIAKFPLGWMNYPKGAFYLSSPTERSVRKGHRYDRIRASCVYDQALRAQYNKLTAQYDRSGDKRQRRELEKKLEAVHACLRGHTVDRLGHEYFVSQVIGSLGNPEYPSLGEALERLLVDKPDVPSLALSREFALSLCSEFHTNSVGVYFNMKMVGFASKEGIKLFPAFKGLLPHLSRSLGITGELA